MVVVRRKRLGDDLCSKHVSQMSVSSSTSLLSLVTFCLFRPPPLAQIEIVIVTVVCLFLILIYLSPTHKETITVRIWVCLVEWWWGCCGRGGLGFIFCDRAQIWNVTFLLRIWFLLWIYYEDSGFYYEDVSFIMKILSNLLRIWFLLWICWVFVK